MKAQNLFFLVLLGFFTLNSCSSRLSHFTQDLYKEQNWTEEDLKKIQFYVSKDIKLKRQLTGGSSEIVSGKIKVENGRKVEVVVIPKGTPGVFVFSPKEERLGISFEDSDKRFLMFGPSPRNNDRFVLLASDWKRSGGDVTYDGKTWRVDEDAAYAALLVDLRKYQKTDVEARTAKGRKVN